MADAKYEELLKNYRKLQKEHRRVLGSRSWKITAPLRQLMGARHFLAKLYRTTRRRLVFWTGPASRAGHSFAIYRIIGNDLYPRHEKGQQYNNLKFILENEPALSNCTKVFIVNRIIDGDEERRIIDLLDEYKSEYVRIPFDPEEYKRVEWDLEWIPGDGVYGVDELHLGETNSSHAMTRIYRHKNNYVMNNNGARNAALRDGKKRGVRWILPWDGNCFISLSAWERIEHETRRAKYLKFFIVPMSRETDNRCLLQADYRPTPESEPQVIFRRDATTEFNEEYSYGRRPKVELLWTLGVPGVWDKWVDYKWDIPRRSLSKEAGEFGVAGWVSRLFSGNAQQEGESRAAVVDRGSARNLAIMSTIDYVDERLGVCPVWSSLSMYDSDQLEAEVAEYREGKNTPLVSIIEQLRLDADAALERAPYSVTDKTIAAPSGDLHDYWSVSPYAHPNPDTEDGLPYVKKDGERAEGTELYELTSDMYDRTRIQRVCDDSITLALAWKFTDNASYIQHAAKILKRFFINKHTRMNPHMIYAQVWMGKNDSKGIGYGIIESRGLYYFLDAVRILHESGELTTKDLSEFKQWLAEYLNWLLQSHQGRKTEMASGNNHATFFDMTVASIAQFIGDGRVLHETLIRARSRIGQQFTPEGEQPQELSRTLSQHYCYFNMKAWLILARIGRAHNIDIWGYRAKSDASLSVGVSWLLRESVKWKHSQIADFDADRIDQMHHMAVSLGYEDQSPGSDPYHIKPVFNPHDGIRPYWNLGLPIARGK